MKHLYLKSVIWEFLLCAAAACALAYTLLDGFYVNPDLQYSALPAVVVVVCLMALFLVVSKRKYMLLGGVIYGAFCLIALIWAAGVTTVDLLFVDFEGNYFIFVMVLIFTATFVFLLSRTKVGIAALFVCGALLAGLIQMFYGRFEIVCTIVFVFSTLALLIYKNYQSSLKSAMNVTKASFAPGFVVAAATTVVACALGAALWFGVIAPLGPGAAEIKLITEWRALETVQVKGVSEEYQIPNLDITSSETNSDSRTTDDIKEALDGTQVAATGEADSNPDNGEVEGMFQGLNLDSLQDAFDLQSNPQNWPLLLVLIFPFILIVGYFVLRRSWRAQRLNQMKALGPDAEFEQAFLYLLSKFEHLGIKVPEGQTMLEFAKSVEGTIYPYEEASGVKFSDLAQSYSTLAYGIKPVEDEDVSNVEAFYNSFWKATRKYLGNVKYFVKSFRLH